MDANNIDFFTVELANNAKAYQTMSGRVVWGLNKSLYCLGGYP